MRYGGANPLIVTRQLGGIVQPATWAQIAAGAAGGQPAQQPAQPPANAAPQAAPAAVDDEEEEEEEEYDPRYDPGPQGRADIDVRPSATTHYNDHDPAENLTWLSTDNQLKDEVIASWGDADWDDDRECWIIYFGNRRVRQNGGGYQPRGCDIRVSFHEGTWRYRIFHFGPTNAAG